MLSARSAGSIITAQPAAARAAACASWLLTAGVITDGHPIHAA